MRTRSLWQDTRTFFPLFLAELPQHSVKTVCVVGASDGKYVIPLALRGYQVLAIERDPLAIDGGPVELPGGTPGYMPGLRQRIETEQVAGQVKIIPQDLFETADLGPCDAVWTSCSWHYSVNHSRPLRDFTARMLALCDLGGLLGAEYMMPVESRHEIIEHYLEQGAARYYFDGCEPLWEAYTPPFTEAPHIGQPEPHTHRMGFIIARLPPRNSNHGMGT